MGSAARISAIAAPSPACNILQNLCPPFELPLDKVRHCDDGAGCVGGGTAVTPATRAFRAEPDTG